MSSIAINSLTNANIYSQGNSLMGRAEEVQLPAIKAKKTTKKVLGLQGEFSLPSGFEEMTGKIKWNAVYQELFEQFGSPYVTTDIQVRANLQTFDTSGLIGEVPVVAFMTVRFVDVLPQLGIKQNENAEQESEFTCTYYRLEINGVACMEFDVMANIFFVMDADQFATYRANLGF